METLIQRTIEPDFDEEAHVFRVDGRVIPGVTYILKSAGIGHTDTTETGFVISEDVMAAARDRGIDVHLACEYFDRNGGVEVDWDEEDEPDWWKYLLAYEQFREDTGFVPDLIEHHVYCAEHDYCGILDRAGWIGDERVVLDLKSGGGGLKPWHGPQTAAYAYALGGDEWPTRMVLELKPQLKRRQYKAHRFSPASAVWDMKVFLAARTLLTFKELSSKAR